MSPTALPRGLENRQLLPLQLFTCGCGLLGPAADLGQSPASPALHCTALVCNSVSRLSLWASQCKLCAV